MKRNNEFKIRKILNTLRKYKNVSTKIENSSDNSKYNKFIVNHKNITKRINFMFTNELGVLIRINLINKS